jgi:hypothetical protein
VLNVNRITEILAELSLLKYFPSEPAARRAMVEMVCNMATHEDQVRWLVRRMMDVHNEWPGPVELRNLFCSRFPPADGIDPRFPDGLPKPLSAADRRKVLGANEQKLITDGSAPDPTLEQDMRATLGAVASLRSLGFSAPATKKEIAAAPEWLRKLEGYE